MRGSEDGIDEAGWERAMARIPVRRVRPAAVIRTGRDITERPTKPIAYTRDDVASAWYAELRAKQAVR